MLDPSRNDGSPEQRSPWSEHDQVASSSSPALDSFAKSDNQNQLDYLVPEEERADAGTPGETQLPEDPVEDLAQNFSQASTFSGPGMEGSMRTACLQAVERFEAQRDWQPDVVQRVLAELNAVVKANTPSPADQLKREELLQRTCALVEEGLGDWVGMHVEPYGSFVSGLYTPSGDVDIAIEGHRRDRFGGPEVPVVELDKEEKAQILKALSKKLERKRMTKGRIERILFARVPILKYTDLVTGIDCDVSVGSGCARFKSTVLRFLGQLDRRFIALTCLVKKWARTHNMNDASNGTFNSFALTLMVAFHLQTQQPPILPPLCEIFQQAADSVAKDALVRPLHGGRQAAPGVLEAAHARLPEYQGYGAANSATVLELFASFFASFQVAIESWTNKQKMRPVRASTWSGDWTYRRWGKNYLFGVEDPFDITDNCSRTIFAKALPQIVRAFASASYALERLSSADGAMRVLRHLFVEPNPQFLPPPLARQSRNQRQAQQAAAAAANQAVRGLGPRGPPRDQLRQEAIQILDLAPGPGSGVGSARRQGHDAAKGALVAPRGAPGTQDGDCQQFASGEVGAPSARQNAAGERPGRGAAAEQHAQQGQQAQHAVNNSQWGPQLPQSGAEAAGAVGRLSMLDSWRAQSEASTGNHLDAAAGWLQQKGGAGPPGPDWTEQHGRSSGGVFGGTQHAAAPGQQHVAQPQPPPRRSPPGFPAQHAGSFRPQLHPRDAAYEPQRPSAGEPWRPLRSDQRQPPPPPLRQHSTASIGSDSNHSARGVCMISDPWDMPQPVTAAGGGGSGGTHDPSSHRSGTEPASSSSHGTGFEGRAGLWASHAVSGHGLGNSMWQTPSQGAHSGPGHSQSLGFGTGFFHAGGERLASLPSWSTGATGHQPPTVLPGQPDWSHGNAPQLRAPAKPHGQALAPAPFAFERHPLGVHPQQPHPHVFVQEPDQLTGRERMQPWPGQAVFDSHAQHPPSAHPSHAASAQWPQQQHPQSSMGQQAQQAADAPKPADASFRRLLERAGLGAASMAAPQQAQQAHPGHTPQARAFETVPGGQPTAHAAVQAIHAPSFREAGGQASTHDHPMAQHAQQAVHELQQLETRINQPSASQAEGPGGACQDGQPGVSAGGAKPATTGGPHSRRGKARNGRGRGGRGHAHGSGSLDNGSASGGDRSSAQSTPGTAFSPTAFTAGSRVGFGAASPAIGSPLGATSTSNVHQAAAGNAGGSAPRSSSTPSAQHQPRTHAAAGRSTGNQRDTATKPRVLIVPRCSNGNGSAGDPSHSSSGPVSPSAGSTGLPNATSGSLQPVGSSPCFNNGGARDLGLPGAAGGSANGPQPQQPRKARPTRRSRGFGEGKAGNKGVANDQAAGMVVVPPVTA